MDILTLVFALGGLLAGLLGKLIISEVQDWSPTIAGRLIDRAVERLPKKERSRYREEWYAHLDDHPGKLGKLWLSIDLFLKAGELATELSRPTRSKNPIKQHGEQRPSVQLDEISWTEWEIAFMQFMASSDGAVTEPQRKMLAYLRDKLVRQSLAYRRDYEDECEFVERLHTSNPSLLIKRRLLREIAMRRKLRIKL